MSTFCFSITTIKIYLFFFVDPEALGSWYICLRNEYFLWEIYKCLYEPFGLINFHIERILRVTFFRRWSFLPTKSSSRGSPKIKTSNCYFLVKYIKFCKKTEVVVDLALLWVTIWAFHEHYHITIIWKPDTFLYSYWNI